MHISFNKNIYKLLILRTISLISFLLFFSEVFSQKVLRVGGDKGFAPYEYIGEENTPMGFNIDILKSVLGNLDYTIDIQLKTWKNIRRDLSKGEIDLVSGMFYSDKRAKEYLFSDPFIKVQHRAFYKKGQKIDKIDQIKDKIIIVQDGDIMHDYVLTNNISDSIVVMRDPENALRYLAITKDVNCVVLMGFYQGQYIIDKLNLKKIEHSNFNILTTDYCFATSKDNIDLILEINEMLNTFISSQEYRNIKDRWFKKYDIQQNIYLKYLNLIVFILVTISILVLIWIYTLKKAVKEKTKELNKNYNILRETTINLRKSKIEAEESNRLKSVFLANISHEIRTPMNAIIGFSSLLKESNTSKDEIDSYADIIINNGKHLVNIINDIIDIAKIDSGQLKINRTEIDVQEVILDIFSMFLKDIQTNKKEIRFDREIPDKPISINTDRTRLYQILINLVSNAIKFTHKGEIKIGAYLHEYRVIFFVKDTGIGISQSMQKKIFDSFIQENDNTQHIYGGTGLGLAICKGLIELLNGEIWLESTKGIGSTFYFSLDNK